MGSLPDDDVPATPADEIRRLMTVLPRETVRDVFTSKAAWSQFIGKQGEHWTLRVGKLHDAGEAVQIEIIAALAKEVG